ncbi:hypothetical protein [Maridesulfovibrio sp.]|uniref:hypothetical protein n=1 Tax=Maridesulfovibrio sp. TaxID=2795000 RepID=UPI0029CA62A6|nr:hypothetical protein [Maridesulfovibrio sp.]
MAIKHIVDEYPDLIRELADYHPIKTASLLSVLLTRKELQSNCYRIETLIHLSILYCRGEKNPNRKFISKLFKNIGDGFCRRMEDPAEDVFVSLVSTTEASFRIFEGLWESSSYYLQRILNVIATMPDSNAYAPFKRSITAMLSLSEIIAERSKIERYTLGNVSIENTLPLRSLTNTNKITKLISFNSYDFEKFQIDKHDLIPFFFPQEDLKNILDEDFGHTTLERYPLILSHERIYVMLPTAISAAIRRYTFEFLHQINMEEVFEIELVNEYITQLSQLHTLKLNSYTPINFTPTESGWSASLMAEFDTGRYIHLEFVLDSIKNFDEHGFLGVNTTTPEQNKDIKIRIEKAIETATKQTNYKGGITIVIPCGYGRGFAVSDFEISQQKWKTIGIGATELEILEGTTDFSIPALWNILEEWDILEKMDVHIENINGILNLFAWIKNNGGHLAPHDQLPRDAKDPDKALMLITEQNGLRKLRHDFYLKRDPHHILSPEKKHILLYKHEASIFHEGPPPPLYVDIDNIKQGQLRAVYESEARTWWCEIQGPENYDSDAYYQHWDMLQGWLKRSVPKIESQISKLPKGAISWTTEFESFGENEDFETPLPDRESLSNEIKILTNKDKKTIHLKVNKKFMRAFRYPDNIAEKTLIYAFILGAQELAFGKTNHEISKNVTEQIVTNEFARKLHYMSLPAFTDFINDSLPDHKITISKSDSSTIKLGLGWRVFHEKTSHEFSGIKECTSFLNDLVQNIESEICSKISKFNRHDIVVKLLANIEKISSEKKTWQRTTRAILQFDGDNDFVHDKIYEEKGKFNAAALASRLLIEIAICESPMNGGIEAGDIDLSQLMALASTVHQYGGYSDAIHKEAMEPRILITSLGDVHLNHDLTDLVMVPFSKAGNKLRTEHYDAQYESNFKPPTITPSVADSFDHAFLSAWESEVGATLDEVRTFMDTLEDWAIEQHSYMITCKLSELNTRILEKTQLSLEATGKIISFLTLRTRKNWKDIPEGYNDKDRQPWRFRRRLSFIRRPILEIDTKTDPTIMIAPGFLRESVIYVLRNYYEGSFPEQQAQTKIMRKWIGKIKNKTGTQFNTEVAERLQKLGWQTKSDVKVTKLLRKGFDKDYGDVDVLAWDNNTKSVLLIECKDLQYHKTLGEVAEQLSDFKGQIKPNGKPDLLKKHLNRMELIQEYPREVAAFVGFDTAPNIQGRLVFRNPVPMQYAWSKMQETIPIFLFDELEQIDG